MEFDPRERDDVRDDQRWGYERGDLERNDPRDPFVRSLDLPSRLERELVQDARERLYELNGDDSRTLAAIGTFRVVAERDLESFPDAQLSLAHLREEGLIRSVSIGHDEDAFVLTDAGWSVLDSHQRDGSDDDRQEFHAGVSRPRELQHDSQLFGAYLNVEERLREQGAEIERVVLEVDLKREYQEFLQWHNRGRADSNGRPDRDEFEIAGWARDHDLPFFDDQVHFPDFRIEYELDGRDRHEDVEVVTEHYRGGHAASRVRAGFTCVTSKGRGGRPFSPRDWEW